MTAALLLSANGYEVTIFEKNNSLGGKVSEVKSNGFRFDTGPSLITMPFIIEALFNVLDKDINQHLKLIEISPLSRNFFPDGSRIDTFRDIKLAKAELYKINPHDAAAYEKYLDYTKKIYDNAAEVFLYRPMHEVLKLIREGSFPSLLQFLHIDSMRTMHKANSTFFADPRLVQIFDRFATYNGSNPYQAPATLNIIAYVEFILGAFYIDGGVYRLVNVFENLLAEFDVQVNKNTEVEEITHTNGKFIGLKVNGEIEKYDYCVCNSDVVQTFSKMISGFEKRTNRLGKSEPSLSGMVFLWGVEGQRNELRHHNVFYSGNYKDEFRDIFKRKMSPVDPTTYVCISSKTNPNHARQNAENWFVLANMPYIEDKHDWENEKQNVRNRIIAKLLRNGIDIQDKIRYEKMISPADLQARYLGNRGSIYGISSNDRMSAFKRYPNRSRDIENLYFCGGSVHPGGGVPLVMLSAANCVELIMEKDNKQFKLI